MKHLWKTFVEQQLAAFAGDFNHVLEVDYLMNAYGCDAFVETGTNMGDTSDFMATAYPNIRVFTCEVAENSFETARARLARHKNVTAELTSSEHFLRNLFEAPPFERPLVFLDAHWFDYWPLPDEIAAIKFGIVNIHDFDIGHSDFHYDRYRGRKCDMSFVPSEYFPVYGNNPNVPGGRIALGNANRGRGYFLVGMDDKLQSSDLFVPLTSAAASDEVKRPRTSVDRPETVALHRNDWLHQHARNETSQCGEDGILEMVIETIGETDRWCVEFGAWDGKTFSNTYNLIANRGYHALLIEADSEKHVELEKNFRHQSGVMTRRQRVGWSAQDNLDAILADCDVPSKFDLLSIDIDGNDYHVWEAVQTHTPKVVCIEFNPTIGNEVEFVQAKDLAVSQGSSLLSICKLARQKGYELVAVTQLNAIFVADGYYPRFNIQDNSLHALRPNPKSVLHIFTGYDGTTHTRGNHNMPWHPGMRYDEARLQQLPPDLREYPPKYNASQQQLFESREQAGYRPAGAVAQPFNRRGAASEAGVFDYGFMIGPENRARTEAYAAALREVVRPDSIVLELGTGMGYFALLAAKFGARHVYAIEPRGVIDAGREAAAENGLADRITFIQGWSQNVELPQRANVMVSDMCGSTPLFRQHVASLVDARRRLLVPNATLIPQIDTLWGAVVSAPGLYDQYIAPWEGDAYGLDLRAARRRVTNHPRRKVIQAEQMLTTKQRWATFEYPTIDIPNFAGRLNWTAARSATAHGFSIWFDRKLTGDVGFSNAPGEPVNKAYSNFFFPWSEPVAIEAGDEIAVYLRADLCDEKYMWTWQSTVRTACTKSDDGIKAKYKQSTFAAKPFLSEIRAA